MEVGKATAGDAGQFSEAAGERGDRFVNDTMTAIISGRI